MELMDKIDQALMTMQQGIDSQSISFLLGILGIAITVFTVVYSFMESTKERKRMLFERVNANANADDVDPVLRADLMFATKRLAELWNMNKSIIAIIIADIVTMFADANEHNRHIRHHSQGLRAPCREAPPRCFS